MMLAGGHLRPGSLCGPAVGGKVDGADCRLQLSAISFQLSAGFLLPKVRSVLMVNKLTADI